MIESCCGVNWKDFKMPREHHHENSYFPRKACFSVYGSGTKSPLFFNAFFKLLKEIKFGENNIFWKKGISDEWDVFDVLGSISVLNWLSDKVDAFYGNDKKFIKSYISSYE